jgi:hypothetical protein
MGVTVHNSGELTYNPVFRALRVDSWNVLLSAIDVDVLHKGRYCGSTESRTNMFTPYEEPLWDRPTPLAGPGNMPLDLRPR